MFGKHLRNTDYQRAMLWPCLAMLATSGGLFALKYAPRAGVSPWIGLAVYLGFFVVQVAVAWKVASALDAMQAGRGASGAWRARLLCWVGGGLYASALLAMYLRVDPLALQIDRWSALDRFWDALLRGEYPYRAPTHLGSIISGFPALFVVALPFRLLGDVGLMQFAALAAFVLLAVRLLRDVGRAAFVMILLAGLPVFGYEVIARSELFSNMVLAAWLLYLGTLPDLFRGRRILLAAIAWGGLLSTRGVVIVPLLLAAFALLRSRGLVTVVAFGVTVSATFGATLLPFLLWDPGYFLDKNPYLVQSSVNIPGWALAVVLIVTSARGGLRGSASPASFALLADAGWILFATVSGCFLLKAGQVGWEPAVWGNGFDISYFALPLPFLLLQLGACASPARADHNLRRPGLLGCQAAGR